MSLYRVNGLHADRGRARRTGVWVIAAARLLAAAAVLLGLMAGALLWWRPDRTGQEQALALGGAALGCGVLWVMVVWRAACWLRRGLIADKGGKPQVVAGLAPDDQGEPGWLWDRLRPAHLVLLCVPLAGLVLALVSAVMLVYAVPFLLAVPWLSGLRAPWTSALAGACILWLLIGPVNHVAKHIPGTAAD
ncbi:hypothetical protein ABTX60_09655 [Streptomyces sp. NPDC126510]|uniref:hypothetical protein n=1 Tax=Streptomyces sp. NPDC126510 TaxID=3155317 RepID=UPI0033202E8A